MELDNVLKQHVGQFGRFQLMVVLVMSLEEMFTAFHMMAPVFLVGKPEHHCHIPNLQQSNCTSKQVTGFTIPLKEDDSFSSCEM